MSTVHRYDTEVPDNLDDEENGSQILEEPKAPATVNLGNSLQASTKIEMLMTTLKSIKQADPTRKTIVFSSFTSMLDKTTVHLQAEGIKFVSCRYSYYYTINQLSVDLPPFQMWGQ